MSRMISVLALCVLILGLGATASLAGDLYVPTGYATIQLAVDAAVGGDVIHVAAGTYPEQVHITTSDISIDGAGVGSTVIASPVTLTAFFTTPGPNDNYPVVFIDGATGVALSDLTVDGANQGDTNYRFTGVSFWNGGGSMTDMEVLNVMNSTFSGAQHGVGVYSYNDTGGPYAIAMTDVLVDDYQKTGVALSGAGMTVDLTRVTTVGQGATAVTAQNGIQISSGAGGTVEDCVISGNSYTGDTWTASGLLPIYGASVTVDGFTLDGNQTSIYLIDSDGSFANGAVTNPTGDALYAMNTGAKGGGSVLEASPFDAGGGGRGARATMTATFTNSTFTGTGATDSWGPSAYPLGGHVDFTVTSCEVSGWDWGIVAYEAGGTVASTVTGNGIYGNTSYGFFTNATAKAVQDVSGNWWGHASGPGGDGPGSGNAVTGAVVYSPWLAAVPGTVPMIWGTNGSIQDAIDAASSGDAINVAAGTYREQLRIDGKSLDLIGAGVGSTIIEAVDTGSRTTYGIVQWTGGAPRTIDACIGVTGAGTVNVSDMTVDGRSLGPDNFYGIHFFDTSGSVTGCRVEDVLNASIPGSQKVASIVATQSDGTTVYTIDFSDNVLPNFQKGGILIMGPDMTFTVDDNDVTNAPSEYNAGNGIQLSYGASGTTSGNVVHGVAYTGDDWSATGILLFECGDVSMDGDTVDACQSGVNYSNWGWIYSHPSVVNLAFSDLLLYDNEWTLSAQLSCDNADLNFAADGCMILDSTGAGIELYGTDLDPWGGSYYMGWDNGDLVADITNCVITGTALDGIWIDDWSGNLTNTMDVEVHYTAMEGSASSGLWNSSSYLIDAEYCWWGDPTGPTVIPEPGRGNQPAAPPVSPYGAELPEQGAVRYAERSSSRAGDGVHGLVDYDPWLGGNIVCDPDPEYLTATDPVKTINVDYLGGGSGLMYGYSVKFTWDGGIASTAPVKVTEGTLLSDIDNTFFFPRTTGTNEITVDCAILGYFDGATGPGTMFSIEFTGLAVGTSNVDITVGRVRDKDNATLTGFYADDGLLIVDVDDPVVADVLITNVTLGHTNDYIKNGDDATVTATVTDDGGLTAADIVADLTGLGGGAAVNPDTYSSGVATWILVGVTCTPPNGVVTVTVTATDSIGNVTSGSDTIISDNIAPTAVTGFDASPANEECELAWDDASGNDLYFDGVVVQRDAVGSEYPQYPWFVANWPAVTAGYAGSELVGANVYNGSGTSHTDGVASRNIYYYQAFCYDIARNYGPADPGARDLATNYWLGDVSDVWGSWGYDGEVDDDDILKLSDVYGTVNPVGVGEPNGDAECDIGPTVHPDWHRLGLPLPDDAVEFEDLMVFAMNYGVVAAKVVPFLPEEYDASPLAVTLGESAGEDVSVALRLEGNASEIKGVSAVVSYDPSELAFVSARLTDDMLSPIGDVFFWFGEEEGRVLVDVAVLGTGVTIGGSGDLAILTFRSLTGEYGLEVESARLRDVDNIDLDARLGDYASGGDLPTVFRLVQNAPNPFNPKTIVAYHVPRESEVTIRVYDVAGRRVRTLVEGVVEPGRHMAVWDGLNESGEAVGSGIYFCTMEAPDFHDSRKMTLLK